MKNKRTNIFLLALLVASPLTVNAQTTGDADTITAKKKVHVAFRDKNADELLGGISYIDMEELQKKDHTKNSLEDLYGLVGGWNGHNLWGMDNYRLDTNDDNNLPLVIIDGVKRPSNNVLPSEIEQITFLKGAQAVVLYGAKAAKGAILITTKRGKVEGLQITANANTGWHVAKAFPDYLGSAEYMTLYNEACVNDGGAPKYSQQDIYNHASGTNPYRYPNVNYYSDEYVRRAYNRSEGTMEIQGGSTRAHFYTNINYYRIEDLLNFGPAKDNYTDRFSVRGNVDLVVNKSVKGFANVSASFYNENRNKGDFWGEAATMRPNFPENAAPLIPVNMVDPNATKALSMLDKSLNLLDGKYFPSGTKNTSHNAIADCYFGGKTTAVSRQFQFDAGIIYDMDKFVKGLSFKTQFAIDYAASYNYGYNNDYAVYVPTWSNYNGEDGIVALTQVNDEKIDGHMVMSDGQYRQTISWNGHLDYDRTFEGKHHFTGMLLGNMFTTTASGEYHRYANANLGLQAGYDFMGRYIADLSLAGVHSARLPKRNREAISPSLSLGWNISKENFMKNVKGVDNLLVSASYSNLNEDVDIYMSDNGKYYYIYESLWESAGGSFTWNDGTSTNRTYSTAGNNPALDFIHRKEFSVNLRGSFLNKLITTDLTFFNTDMSGYIAQIPTTFPSHLQGGLSGGTLKSAINNDIQTRRGIDFSITAQKQFGQVHATLGVVGTYLYTKYSKFDEIVEEDYQKTEGNPIDGAWGYNCVGFYTDDDFDISQTKEGTLKYDLKKGLAVPENGGIRPGDLKYEDVNHDNIINSKDMICLGKTGAFGAPFSMGVNLTLKYKDFTLFMLGDAQIGASGMKSSSSYYYMSGNDKYSINARGRWTPETAETATHPRLTTKTSFHNGAASSFWFYRKNYFRLDKIQLTYDFPEKMLKGKVVKALSVYLYANDLFTIAEEQELLDLNVGSAPQTRFYNLGVKVTL